MYNNESKPESISGVNEVIWRKPSSRTNDNCSIQRRGSEISSSPRQLSFYDDSCESGFQITPYASPLQMRKFYNQRQRQNSTTLQDHYLEQAREFSRSNCGITSQQPPPAPSSFYSYDALRNRHSAIEINMHSSDSLTSNDRRSSGSSKNENQTYNNVPYASSPPRTTMGLDYHQQQMSSPILARRELSNPQQQPQQGPVPYHQPQMLVDPNTGQHYLIPQAHPQPQYFYPVIPTPVYALPQGYIVTNQGQPPQSPTRSRAMYFHQQPQQQQQQSYFVEPPPSSNVSVCGGQQQHYNDDYFIRNHSSRQSLESGSSSNTECDKTRIRKNSRDSISPILNKEQNIQQQQQNQQRLHQQQNDNNLGGKFSTTSSCTSGFISTDSTMNNDNNLPLFNANKSRPQWWGTSELSTRIGIDDSSLNRNKLTENKSLNSNEKLDEKTPTQETETIKEEIKKPVQKSIRMDIDLKSHEIVETEKKPQQQQQQQQQSRPTTTSTAFTVTFDEEKKPLSLQDAAKQLPKRLLRRSMPAKQRQQQSTTATTDSESEHQDPKHYLFNKMIQGVKRGDNADLGSIKDDKEFDTLSEAGTYVVDTSTRMKESQIITEDEAASSSESSDDETESTISKPSTSSKEPNDPNPSKSLLAQRLEELRKRTNQQIDTKKSLSTTNTTNNKDGPNSTRLCQRHIHTAPSASTANNTNFRRGDGGRYSMRTTSTATTLASTTNFSKVKPPFKAGAAPLKKTSPTQSKDNPEMVAWLRRKEYDPRKSAAEAKKIQQLKAREKIFQQNRSISFNPTSNITVPKKPSMNNEQHKSHDDLSHIGEDDEMKNNKNDDLTRQVDALTQKCLKSIQLIKLCNQNTLSESVENLLDRAVISEDEPKTTTEQLERLSSAFDAIQKYFEEQRSNSASPPVFRRLASTPAESSLNAQSASGSRHIPPEERI